MKLSYSKNLFILKIFIGFLFSIIYIHNANASMATIELNIVVTEPPNCSFGGGNILNISFGEVQELLIDGKLYKKTKVDYDLKCTNLTSNLLTMKLSWTNFKVNGIDAIKTNRDSLGIAVYQDNKIIANNSNLDFSYGTMPSIYAVPIKPDDLTLSDAGDFNGEMIMTIDYQ